LLPQAFFCGLRLRNQRNGFLREKLQKGIADALLDGGPRELPLGLDERL
jgi:hypothetical protein